MLKKLTSIIAALSMTAAIIPSAALAANGDAIEARTNDVDIRIGVFGDTHVTAFPVDNDEGDWTSTERAIAPIMRHYKTMASDIDAFAMPGDVIYNVGPEYEKTPNDEDKYNAVLDKMGEFFTIDTTTDAVADTDEAEVTSSKVIWSMGNHEITQGAYSTANVQFDEGRTWEQEVLDNKARYTEALGHEPCYTTTVNGYTFVTAEPYSYLNDYVNPADKSVMSDAEKKAKGYLEAALADGTNKPVFYLQHEAIDKTFFGSSSTIPTRNSAEFREFILNNPRIITISGHTHFPAQDPRCFYQAANGSTHINIPVTMGGNMAGYSVYDEDNIAKNTSHGILIEVVNDVVTVLRFDVTSGKYIGEPYVFTAGEAKECYTDARYNTAKASEVNVPYFEGEASVSEITNNTAKLNFPAAKKDGESAEGLQDSFVHFYNVSVTNTKTGNVVATKRLLEDFWRQDDVKRTSRNVYLENLSRNTTYEVSIVATSSLGQASEALTATFTTTNEKTAEDLALTTKTTKNVALGKTVTFSNGTTYPAMVNGKKAEDAFAETVNNGDALILDLGRRYNVEQIVLNSKIADSQGKLLFELYASNDPTFPENNRTKIYTSGGSNTDFDANHDLTINLSGNTDYRYIKYVRTNPNPMYIYLSEIEVYADEYETEVSRNAEVFASHTYSDNQPASKIIDGKNEEEADGWMSGWLDLGQNAYIYLDLGTTLPITRIEMEGLFNSKNATAHSRGYWNVYGSTTMKADDLVTTDGAWGVLAKINNENYTELASTGVGKYIPLISDASHRENIYKLNQISDSNNADLVGIVREEVSGNYRYITFHHGINNLAALGEVRVFAANPTLNSAKKAGDTITLSFSDPMNADTLNNNSVKVYDVNDEIIEGAVVTPSTDGYSATVTNVADAFKVQVTYDILGASGAEIAGEMVKYFEEDVNYSGKPVVSVKDVNVALGKKVIGSDDCDWTNLTDGNLATSVSNTGTNEGKTYELLLDLGKRYDVNRVVLYCTQTNNNGRQSFTIYGANEEDFSDKVPLYSCPGFADIEIGQKDFTYDDGKALCLDIEDGNYRYIKLVKNDKNWLMYEELQVFADYNLMEVSRGASAVANKSNGAMVASKIVDGKNEQHSDGWMTDWSASNDYVYLDLGTTLPISRIEMETLFNSDNATAHSRGYWNVYGSTIMNEADLVTTDGKWGVLAKINNANYTELVSTGVGRYIPLISDASHRQNIYKLNQISDSNNKDLVGIVREEVSGDYRYITFHHGCENLAALGEVRVYSDAVSNVNTVKLDGNKVTVSFSDKMFPTYLNSSYIKITDSNGVELEQKNITENCYDYSFTVDGLELGKTYTVTVDEAVKNMQYSMPLGADVTKQITVPYPAELTKLVIKDASDNVLENGVDDMAEGAVYTLEASVETEITGNITVIVAQKTDKGRLVAAYTGVVTDGVAKISNVAGIAQTDVIEVYIVSGTDTLTPYGEKTTY